MNLLKPTLVDVLVSQEPSPAEGESIHLVKLCVSHNATAGEIEPAKAVEVEDLAHEFDLQILLFRFAFLDMVDGAVDKTRYHIHLSES